MSNADQFFEEEEELARTEAAAQRARRTGQKAPKAAAAKTRAVGAGGAAPARKPPSLGMVIAIAAVAVLLGICIGYFIAMAVVDRGAAPSAATGQTSMQGSSDGAGMPTDHPDIASLLNPDGTVNEEALAQYKADLAERQGSSDADANGAADGDGEDGAAS